MPRTGRLAGVAVGLEGCEFIDSMALAALSEPTVVSRRTDSASLFAPSAQVRRVLNISELDRSGFIIDSVDDALSDPDLEAGWDARH